MLILGRLSSINVRKALWTAEETGLAFDHDGRWGTPEAPTASPAFTALNPNALIPVLQDGEAVLWESNTICRYLATKAGREDLLPRAALARAEVEMWMDWQSTELNDAWRYAFLALVRRQPERPEPERIEESARRWNGMMRILDRRLAETGAFVAGGQFSLADIVLGLSTHRWRSTPIEHASAPFVAEWMKRLEERPASRRYLTAASP